MSPDMPGALPSQPNRDILYAMSDDSARTKTAIPRGADKPVSFWYILLLVTFSLGTASVTFCSNQPLQITLGKFTDSTGLIGFVIALQALNQLWATPYAAWKSDRIWTRIGRRKPLVLILTPLLAVCILCVPHCPNLWILIFLVFVLQVAEDAELAVLMPAISDSVPDRQRPLATGMWQLAVSAAGFLMGRFAMKLMDRHEHWPYIISAITVFVTGIVFLIVMRERYVPPRPQEKFRLFAYGREIFRLREHRLIYLIFFFQPLFYLVAIAFFARMATTQWNLKPSEYGAAYSYGPLTTILLSFPLGMLFNRVKLRRVFCIAACAYAFIPMTYGIFFMHTAREMAIFFSLQIIAFLVFRLNFMPYVMEYTTPKNCGTILGFTNAANGLVRFTTLPLAGLLVDLTGRNYKLPLWGGYLGALVCIAALLMMRPPEQVRHLLEGNDP